MELYLCVHSITDAPEGMAIRTATELKCNPPWVMGAAHPSTHAYVAWRHPDDYYYRLDAQPGGAKLSLCKKLGRDTGHIAAWYRVKEGDLASGLEKAISLIGVKYDFFELAPQLLGPSTAINPLFKKFKILPGIKGLPKIDLFKDALICTHLTSQVMEAVGGKCKDMAVSFSDRLPERFARAWEDASKTESWIERVI